MVFEYLLTNHEKLFCKYGSCSTFFCTYKSLEANNILIYKRLPENSCQVYYKE